MEDTYPYPILTYQLDNCKAISVEILLTILVGFSDHGWFN